MNKYVWNDAQPIYRQLIDLIVARILDHTYPEGEFLPSVRQLANDHQVNPLTAAKAIQELAKDNITEKHRGIGFVVRNGVREVLLKHERERFMRTEWPEVRARIERLGLDLGELMEVEKEK